ncbi:MAG TPA: hypothetical protein VJU61_24130, partial [Polyangiaceae bacterium]|nr:hypothetical protein [Polyangiaceae bacterium]
NCADEPPTEAECGHWAREAFTGRRDAQNQADRACSQDADCVIVDYALDCFADCGYPSAVSSAAVPRLEDTIEALDQRACRTFEARGCAVPVALPCVPAASTRSAECREGACTLVSRPL